jgi:hypothetical protein
MNKTVPRLRAPSPVDRCGVHYPQLATGKEKAPAIASGAGFRFGTFATRSAVMVWSAR